MFDVSYVIYGLLGYCIVRVVRNPAEWSLFINLLPLEAFLIYARYYHMTDEAWTGAFIVGGAVSCIVTAIVYRYAVIDRLFLGINIWLTVGALAFLLQWWSILNVYGTYKGPLFFAYILAIGIITTFFTKAGFIGDMAISERKRKQSSLILLTATLGAFVWSLITNGYGLLPSTAAPFISLRIIKAHVQDGK